MGLDKKSQQMDTSYNSCTPKKGKTEKPFQVAYVYKKLSHFFKTTKCLLRTTSLLKNKQSYIEIEIMY